MNECISENNRRREKQLNHNKKHHISPKTIIKPVEDILVRLKDMTADKEGESDNIGNENSNIKTPTSKKEGRLLLKKLEFEMNRAADTLEFEKAIAIRDKIQEIESALKL